jgi:hypothetical protein
MSASALYVRPSSCLISETIEWISIRFGIDVLRRKCLHETQIKLYEFFSNRTYEKELVHGINCYITFNDF